MIEGRTIIIFKSDVLDQVNAITQKYKDAALAGTEISSADAMTSDTEEPLDNAVLLRHLEFRHAQVRRRLSFAIIRSLNTFYDDNGKLIEKREGIDASDMLSLHPVYAYEMKPSDSVTGDVMETLATYIHEYLVRGALFDWYKELGSQQYAVYADADKLLDDAVSSMQSGIVWHQPFPNVGSYKIR